MSLAAIPTLRFLGTRHRAPLLLALPALLILAACTSAAPSPTPAKPTAASAAKTTAPTPAAPKPAPGASPSASPSPSPVPAASLEIVDATLADATPWISLKLSDGEPRIVSGWRIEVGAQSMVIPGNAIVQPGETLILHVGEGRSSEREVFLGPESNALALAAAPGARVRLINATGEAVAETTVPRF